MESFQSWWVISREHLSGDQQGDGLGRDEEDLEDRKN